MRITVTGFIFHNNKLLLIKHKKTGKWLPAGGHSEPGETLDETLRREIKEELNLEITFLEQFGYSRHMCEEPSTRELPKPFYIHVTDSAKGRKMNFDFLCLTADVGNIRILEDELEDYRWFTEEEIKTTTELIDPIRILASEAFATLNNH